MPNPFARLNTALQGRFAIDRESSEGGLVMVYLAEDLRHEPSLEDVVREA